ncbi:nuclear transport factor 2 family protein [Streptomyces sp. NPDC008313]|uniref:nuclear transport factor 2 family protein n=1 Tax=Streptomyces sp. NPDC008313 TaxID=3364826 RepID=UPI0036ED1329
MTIQVARLSDPAVRAFVTALNAHDRDAFLAVLAPDATMSDDGLDRDLDEWTEREIFSSNGHIDVDNQSRGGLALVARYRNDAWGEMRTRWHFTVDGSRITRFETGQA